MQGNLEMLPRIIPWTLKIRVNNAFYISTHLYCDANFLGRYSVSECSDQSKDNDFKLKDRYI